jgi:hypothetical protein
MEPRAYFVRPTLCAPPGLDGAAPENLAVPGDPGRPYRVGLTMK